MEYGPRHRVTCEAITDRTLVGGWYNTSGVMTQDHTLTYNPLSIYKIMDDVVVENFEQRRSSGEIINNPCEKHLIETLNQPSHWYCINTQSSTYRKLDAYFSEGLPAYTAYQGIDLDTVREQAATSAYAKVSSAELSMLVTLGELKETRELLKSVIDRLWRVGQIILRKRELWWELTAKNLDVFNHWLELRYAWRPLRGEISAICKTLQKAEEELATRQTFRSGQRVYSTGQDITTSTYNSGNGQHIWTYMNEYQTSGSVFGGVLAKQRYAGFPDTYGLTKVPQAIFDLTRLSFVVGWIFNVADVIAAWTPDTLWSPLCSWNTVSVAFTRRRILLDFECTNTYHTTCTYSSGTCTEIDQIYHRLPDVPRGIVPSLKINFDFWKLIDSIALAKQFWTGLLSTLSRRPR